MELNTSSFKNCNLNEPNSCQSSDFKIYVSSGYLNPVNQNKNYSLIFFYWNGFDCRRMREKNDVLVFITVSNNVEMCL